MAEKDLNRRLRKVLAREQLGVLVVYFRERRLVMPLDIEEAGKELQIILAESENLNIVLDFGALKQISSGFISKVITFRKALTEKGGKLAICSMTRNVQRAFRITGLEKVFTIAKDQYAAASMLLEE